MVRYIGLAEESTFRTAGTGWLYFKLLSESLNTTREDFFPETTDYWVPGSKAEGFFRTSGSFDTLVEPVLWPKLLALFLGDGTSTATTLVVEDCEDAWTPSANVTCTADGTATNFKVGTNSAKQVFAAGFTTGVAAYEDFAPVDMSGYLYLQFWIKSDNGAAAGAYQILLDDTSACVNPIESLAVPALTAATWRRVRVALADPSLCTAILSVGLNAVTDPVTDTVRIDDVRLLTETDHVFKFGADEAVGTTAIKPFTTRVGVGIEKDRQIVGCVVESMTLEAVAREEVSSTVSVIGSGSELLDTATSTANVEAGWALYTQPYLTFSSAQTMTIATVDRLTGTVGPTIEAFRLTLTRGWDADHYVLGTRFLAAPTLSGMASVEGSMDFSFTSQDEHERFLAAVGTYQAGNQAAFEIILNLRGALILGSEYYKIQITLPEVHYTASTASVSGRDRIVQSVDFRALYNTTDDCACQFDITNVTYDYADLEFE